MASLNRLEIIGKLGKDPELKTSAKESKTSYLFLGVATDDYVGKGPDNKAKYETTWHDVTVFGALAEYIAKNAKKGSTVYVEGRLEKKKKEGDSKEYNVRVIATNVIVLGDKPAASTSDSGSTESRGSKAAETKTATETTAVAVETEEDLPFRISK